MATSYGTRRRGRVVRGLSLLDDFTRWLLFGRETWLIALFKGVALFLFLYFIFFYIPDFFFWIFTLPRPFEPYLDFEIVFSADVGYLIGNGIGIGNLVLVAVLALVVQASRGRYGPGWMAVRLFVLANYLLTGLVIIPYMCFSLAGGTLIRFEAETAPIANIPNFSLGALGFATLVAGIAAAAFAYQYFEYRRMTRQDAAAAGALSRAYSTSPGGG